MNQLYRLLDNWSKSCDMATVIIDTEGNQVSEDFGITEFCRMVQFCDKGKAFCMETWKSDLDGIYECPFGFWDFSIPIVLPDGQVLGKVLAGQALSVKQKDVDQTAVQLQPNPEPAVRKVQHDHRQRNDPVYGDFQVHR